MSYAYFAGGCFWCITPSFDSENGVKRVISGYSGGSEANPTYDDVKHQRTGHRETIRIEYDPALISFGALLDIFLNNTDPFDGDGQFIDRGHSYTLAVYYNDEDERSTALCKLKALESESSKPVFVSVEPFTAFWTAEEYHQDYHIKNPNEFDKELIVSGRKEAEISLSKAKPSDLSFIAEIMSKSLDLDEGKCRIFISENAENLIVITLGKEKAGAAVISGNALICLFILPEYRNKGIGTRIWKEIEDFHPEIRTWTTTVNASESRAISFLTERCGFTAVDENTDNIVTLIRNTCGD